MNVPGDYDPQSEIQKHTVQERILFENRIEDLMMGVAGKLSGKVRSIQMMRDDNFVHRRDRKTNDVHAFFELSNGQYFHLRTYTRHMLDMDTVPSDKILLTGYTKAGIAQIGGTHSLKQDWYQWDADTIASEVVRQNPSLFN